MALSVALGNKIDIMAEYRSLYKVYFLNLYSFIVAYFILPETENRTLEEIELHFSDNSKSLIDINICRIDSVDCIESGAHNSGQQNADRWKWFIK